MALMFRSVLQNAGGAAELIVTCDSEFAGATISCSDGITTLNKTCPSSSPYEVTFKIPNSGDWTISATVSGTTYSSDPISVDLDYSTVLEYGFNWKRWVDTAQYLDSTDYSTLSDLLADEEAVRELCLEHACVDYLCSGASVTPALATVIADDVFAKWVNNSDYALDKMYANAAIKTAMDTAGKYGYGEWVIIDNTTAPKTWGPKGNVPVMTANNAPYGSVNSDSIRSSNYFPYQAFNSDANGWCPTAAGEHWVQYTFTNPVCLKALSFKPLSVDYSSNSYVLQGSNDGFVNDTHDIHTFNGAASDVEEFISVNNSSYYMSYRVKGYFTNQSGGVKIQFYGRELSVSVPAMASNTTPYGECYVDQVTSNAYKMFDKNGSTYWQSDTGQSTARVTNIWYDFLNPVEISNIIVRFVSSTVGNYNYVANGVTAIKLLGSNDNGANYTEIADFTIAHTPNEELVIQPTTAYKRIALRINGYTHMHVNPANGGELIVSEVEFYGKDYSEKEFETGTTKKWLYDHGVELETLDYTSCNTASATMTNTGNELRTQIPSGSGNIAAVIQTNQKIDLTDYNYIFNRAGHEFVNYSQITDVYSNKVTDYTTVGNYRIANANNDLPLTNLLLALDISSFNQEAIIGLNGRKSNPNGCVITCTELWLE